MQPREFLHEGAVDGYEVKGLGLCLALVGERLVGLAVDVGYRE